MHILASFRHHRSDFRGVQSGMVSDFSMLIRWNGLVFFIWLVGKEDVSYSSSAVSLSTLVNKLLQEEKTRFSSTVIVSLGAAGS